MLGKLAIQSLQFETGVHAMKNYIMMIKAYKIPESISKGCYWIAKAVIESKRENWEIDAKEIISEALTNCKEKSKVWNMLEELRAYISELVVNEDYFE